jgi:hypothetical protein
MNGNRFEQVVAYAQTKRGRENMGLTLLAAGCVAGIVVIGKL